MYNRLRNMFDRGKNMAQKIILTGDRPTGKLHVGHYVGSLKRRVELQNSGEYDKIFIMIADAQALTDNADNPAKVRSNIMEVALDYLSVGIDPAKSDIFIQSYVTELTELTFYYMNLVTVSRLQRNPTVKSEIQMRNFETSQLDFSVIRSVRRQISLHSMQRQFRSVKTRCRCLSRQRRSCTSLMPYTARH